jgi:hypothetical protein
MYSTVTVSYSNGAELRARVGGSSTRIQRNSPHSERTRAWNTMGLGFNEWRNFDADTWGREGSTDG